MAHSSGSREQLASSLSSLATTREDSPHPSWFTFAQTIPSVMSPNMSPDSKVWKKKSISIEKNINKMGDIKSNSTESLRLESLYNRTWYIENQKLLRGESASHPVIEQADNMLKIRSDSYAALDDSVCTGETPKRWEAQFINFLSNSNRSSSDLATSYGTTSSSTERLGEVSQYDDAANYPDDLSISADVIAAPIAIILHKPTPTTTKLKESSIFSSATSLLRSRSVSPPITVAINNSKAEEVKAPTQAFNAINISKLPQSHATAMQVKDRQNPDVGLRLKFTGFHNTSENSNDNACAFLGDELSLKSRFFDVHTQSREMGLNRAYSLEQLEEVKHTPFLVEMPLYRDDIRRKDLNKVFELVAIDSWIVPFIIRCLIVNRGLINKLINLLPSVYNNRSTSNEEFKNYTKQWPILSTWRSLGPLWLSKDPSWRPWDKRIILITDNYLFEVSTRSDDESNSLTIIGFACLHGATITNAPCFFQEGEETNALCISCSRSNNENSRKVVFWLRCDDAAQMSVIEREIRLAASLEADSLYEMKDSGADAGLDLLGTGRFNIVRVGRRSLSSKKSLFRVLDGDVNTSVSSSCSGSSDSDGDDFKIFHSSDLDLPALATESKTRPKPRQTEEPAYRALKLVSKPIFRSRVKSGKERGDALVREVVAQILACFQARNCNEMGESTDNTTVVELFGVFETSEGFLMELELMSKVDLFEKISTNGIFNEIQTKKIVKQLLVATSCCYSAGIAHRDIKLSNITFSLSETNETNLNVKLADFGMAGFVCPDNKLRGRCGTPGYVAPDILDAKINEGYDINVDMFSIGVVAYVLLCGYEPFYGEDDKALIKSNKAVQYQYHSPEWDHISSHAKDWISLALKPNTAHRLSIKDALVHPWLKDV